MKGIILAGGSGSRLYPMTVAVSKQLLPVYNKPMIYYPLSVLMMADLKEICIITTPQDQASFQRLLGDGSDFGIRLCYKTQAKPNGLAAAFIIAEDFIGGDAVCLVLGDNIFYGAHLPELLRNARNMTTTEKKAVVFGYTVKKPNRYGVATIDAQKNVLKIEEKPKKPTSNYAVTGLYFYPNEVIEVAKKITPSARGELEITDVNQHFVTVKKIKINLLGRGYSWLDTGTNEALCEATDFIKTIEKRTGLAIACLEEIALEKNWITAEKIKEKINHLQNNCYGVYLKNLMT